MTLSPLMLIGATTAGSAAARGVDRVIEQAGTFAKLLASAHAPTSVDEPATDAHETGDLRRTAEQTLADFSERLQRQLAERGISTTLRFRLEGNGQGGIRVAGDHPQRARIEQAINSDPQLLATFQYLSATHSLLAAAERHSELAERYLGDPVLGAVKTADFAQGEEPAFSLTVNGEEIRAEVGAEVFG